MNEVTKLEELYQQTVKQLSNCYPDSEEYKNLSKLLVDLEEQRVKLEAIEVEYLKTKSEDENAKLQAQNERIKIFTDVLLTAVKVYAAIKPVAWLIEHEKDNFITSKVYAFLAKPRIF